jgi:hypothetical protein
MKKTILLLMWLLVASYNFAQTGRATDYLRNLPKDLKLENSIRTYRMTTDYYNYNLGCDFLAKVRTEGIITYGLGDSVRWNDVYVSGWRTSDTDFPKGVKKDYIENFTYIPDEHILTPEFFQENIPEADPLIMNLVWDAMGFEVFAYACWDSLTLNKEFQAKSINSAIQIANIGTFDNKDTRITWTCITEMNGEICAIFKYSCMNNPLFVEWENMTMKGRSHYWGEVYVSLSNKQIEYANLMEDVLTDVTTKGVADNALGYTVRTIAFLRIN